MTAPPLAGRSYDFPIPRSLDAAQAVFQAQLAFQAHVAAQAEVIALAGNLFLGGLFFYGGNKLAEPRLLGQARQDGGEVDDDAVHIVGQLQVNFMNLGLATLLLGDLQNHFKILANPGGHAPVPLAQLGYLFAFDGYHNFIGGFVLLSLVVLQGLVVKVDRVPPADDHHGGGNAHQDQDQQEGKEHPSFRFHHASSSFFWASASSWPALLLAIRFLASYMIKARVMMP